MTVGIYIRVSTEEQVKEGFSISAQREKLKAFCVAQGWDDFKYYIDEGISGRDKKRPQLQTLLKHVEEGMIKTLLVYRLDRLTRSVRDLHTILDHLNKYGCVFKSATEVYDTSSAIGRMFITIVAAMAEWESANLGERVKMGQLEKARQGEWAAQAPYGFKKVNKKLVIVEEQKEVILDMIEKIKSGYSFRQLALYMESTTHRPKRGYKWHIRSLMDILSNPALYGAMYWDGQIYENTHEAILSKKEFDKLQKLVSSRQNHKKRNVKSIFIFQMKIKCPVCGSFCTSERSVYHRKTDDVQVELNNYRCQVCALAGRKPAFGIPEEKLENALIDYMKNLELAAPPKIEKLNTDEKYQDLLKRQKALENQREKYQKAWSTDLMTDDEFVARMQETKIAIEQITKELENIQGEDHVEFDIEEAKAIAKSFVESWGALTQQDKREFVQRFIKEIHLIETEKNKGRGFRNQKIKVTDVHFY